jgi:hypothetical protein
MTITVDGVPQLPSEVDAPNRLFALDPEAPESAVVEVTYLGVCSP